MGEGEEKAHGEQCDISAHWPKKGPMPSWIVELDCREGPTGNRTFGESLEYNLLQCF